METLLLLGTVLGLGFVSGINLYATVLALGLAFRFDMIQLDPSYEELQLLSHPAVLITAGLMYTVEFVADKVPWFDSLWDTVHTFIRPIGAAALAGVAIGNLDPAMEIALILLCGGVALTSHGAKAGTRLAANHSPEPVSNWSLSVAEDAIAFGGVWLLLAHPIVMFGLVLAFLAAFAWLFPKLVRVLRGSFSKLTSLFKKKAT